MHRKLNALGCIEPFTPCPFTCACPIVQACKHKGKEHPVAFSCGAARALDQAHPGDINLGCKSTQKRLHAQAGDATTPQP